MHLDLDTTCDWFSSLVADQKKRINCPFLIGRQTLTAKKYKVQDLLIGRRSTAADWTLEDGVLLALYRPPEEASATDAHVGPIIIVLSGWTSAHLATGG